jgi:hypothetical protein
MRNTVNGAQIFLELVHQISPRNQMPSIKTLTEGIFVAKMVYRGRGSNPYALAGSGV